MGLHNGESDGKKRGPLETGLIYGLTSLSVQFEHCLGGVCCNLP